MLDVSKKARKLFFSSLNIQKHIHIKDIDIQAQISIMWESEKEKEDF